MLAVSTACLFGTTGCGEQGDRLLKLASYEPVTVEARGDLFVQMSEAYYRIRPNEIDDDRQQLLIGDLADVSQMSMNSRAAKALRFLLDIDLVARHEIRIHKSRVESMTPIEIWNALSWRAREAFHREFHSSSG